MTNDSTYQLDNALLISDEGNAIFSDIQIIVWKLAWPPLVCPILFVVIRGGGGYQCPDLARWDHDNKKPDYNSDRNIL